MVSGVIVRFERVEHFGDVGYAKTNSRSVVFALSTT